MTSRHKYNENRVVVTGLGTISSIGMDIASFSDGLKSGSSGISEITAFDTSGFHSKLGGQVKGFDSKPFFTRSLSDKWGRSACMAVAATKRALQDANLHLDQLSEQVCDVIVGTTNGEAVSLERLTFQAMTQGPGGLSSRDAFKSSGANLSDAISEELRLCGESLTISTACAAGNYAISTAYDSIRRGDCNIALSGGSDSMCRKTFAGFMRLGIVAPLKCQPFDRNRKGMIPGEGAAMLVLENYDHAKRRGASIYAEVLGYELNCDATHMVAQDVDTIISCMKQAQINAGVLPHEIDYVGTHGTGTVGNDLNEFLALKETFGGKIPPASSIKSMLGHTMGAASAFSAIACCLAIKDDFLPPTINYEQRDSKILMDCVPNKSRRRKVRVAQNNGFAFGGNNAILILSEVRDD